MNRFTKISTGLFLIAVCVPLLATPAPAAVDPDPPIVPTPVPPCGNGYLDWDEECDDGNLEAGDACPAVAGEACRYTTSGLLIHGDPRSRRVRELGCLFEWYVVNPHQAPNRAGMPNETQVCRDQDPTCDFDPTPGLCRFQVVVCLNNEDVNLPQCEPRGISAIRVSRPKPSVSSRLARRNANFAALAHAIGHLHDPGWPQSGYTSAPALPPRERNFCSAPFAIEVERGRRRSVSEKLVVDVWDWASQPRAKLRSTLKLSCAG